ncbi:hypothetical protein ACP26L_05810 [Paenibacillus sp. S-38]|uniref:hypothetical protein n=1 Tax=Paenibacillus sp. S-38 TaxID=3416710 RepID=UPI003CEA7EFB
MATAVQNWQEQCQEIQNACSNGNWSQVIQECNELIQYAQQQSVVTADTAAQNNAQQSYQGNARQQQLLIQAHAEQD